MKGDQPSFLEEKKRRPDELPERGSDPLEGQLERALYNLLRLGSVLQVPGFVNCHLSWGGLLWCSCLWVIFAPVITSHYLSPIFLKVILRKFIGSPSWSLVVSVLWSIIGCISGVSGYCSCLPRKSLSYNQVPGSIYCQIGASLNNVRSLVS